MEYSIKTICAYSGIQPDTLRKWEMRYNLVSPKRSGNGYRLYGDEDLERLRLFRELCASGLPAHQAAAAAKRCSGNGRANDSLVRKEAWRAIESSDHSALSRIFVQSMKARGLAGSFQKIWFPLLRRLGECGVSREVIWIAREHFATSHLKWLLLHHTKVPRTGSPALVALTSPEGESHELGMLVASCALWRNGISNAYLGPNMPLESLCRILPKLKVRHLCMTVTNRIERADFRAIVRRLRGRFPALNLYFAGQATFPLANLIPKLGAVFLGTHMEIGLDILTRRIRRPR